MTGTGTKWKHHLIWIGAVGVLVAAVLFVRYAGSGDNARRQKRRATKDWGKQPARIHGPGYSMPVPAGFHVPTGALAEKERRQRVTVVYADAPFVAGGTRGFVGAKISLMSDQPRPAEPVIDERSERYCEQVHGRKFSLQPRTKHRLPIGMSCQSRIELRDFPSHETLETLIEDPRRNATLTVTCFLDRRDKKAWKACDAVLKGLRWE